MLALWSGSWDEALEGFFCGQTSSRDARFADSIVSHRTCDLLALRSFLRGLFRRLLNSRAAVSLLHTSLAIIRLFVSGLICTINNRSQRYFQSFARIATPSKQGMIQYAGSAENRSAKGLLACRCLPIRPGKAQTVFRSHSVRCYS